MSKSNAFESAFLRLVFNGTPIANIADNAASSPLTNLYISLHTADPGEAGDQSTSEVAYTGYQRMAIIRTTGGWTEANGSVSPVVGIEFPEMTGGANGTATHAAVGVAASGAGMILYKGPLTPTVPYEFGVTPRIPPSSVITED